MRQSSFATVSLAILALAACQRQAGPETAAVALAPTPTSALGALPPAPPSPDETAFAPPLQSLPAGRALRIAYAQPSDEYRWQEEAYAMNDAYGDAPPDYAFDDGDVAPTAWLAGSELVRVGERVPGGMRYYYYQPGADAPYYVQDPDYGYGYAGGDLAVVYDSYGRPLSEAIAIQQAADAARYYARADALRHAALHAERLQVALAAWQANQQALAARQQRWAAQLQQDQAWQDYHDAQQARETAIWATQQAWRAQETQHAEQIVEQRQPGLWKGDNHFFAQRTNGGPPPEPQQAQPSQAFADQRAVGAVQAQQRVMTSADAQRQAQMAAEDQHTSQAQAIAQRQTEAHAAAQSQASAQRQALMAANVQHGQAQAANHDRAMQEQVAQQRSPGQAHAQAAERQQAMMPQHAAQAQQHAERPQPGPGQFAVHQQAMQQAHAAQAQEHLAQHQAASAQVHAVQAQAAQQHAVEAAARAHAPGPGAHPPGPRPDDRPGGH